MQSNVDDLEDASNELMLLDDDQVLLLPTHQRCCRCQHTGVSVC